MTAELYYRRSKLDKVKQFAVVAENVWIWYYIGMNTGCIREKFWLYPYKPADSPAGNWRLLKKYEYNGAREIADWISKRIFTKIRK